jgi:hypothetical protein
LYQLAPTQKVSKMMKMMKNDPFNPLRESETEWYIAGTVSEMLPQCVPAMYHVVPACTSFPPSEMMKNGEKW